MGESAATRDEYAGDDERGRDEDDHERRHEPPSFGAHERGRRRRRCGGIGVDPRCGDGRVGGVGRMGERQRPCWCIVAIGGEQRGAELPG